LFKHSNVMTIAMITIEINTFKINWKKLNNFFLFL
jgi:hypothetical protein